MGHPDQVSLPLSVQLQVSATEAVPGLGVCHLYPQAVGQPPQVAQLCTWSDSFGSVSALLANFRGEQVFSCGQARQGTAFPPRTSHPSSPLAPVQSSVGIQTVAGSSPSLFITMDTSNFGWGYQSTLWLQGNGLWSWSLLQDHINGMVVLLFLQRHPTLQGQLICFHMNSKAAVQCISNQGSMHR